MGSQAFIMKVISGYMLAVTAGNAAPGIELSDDENKALEELVEEMTGKNVQEVLAEGLKALETVPLGGGGGGAAPAAASGGDGGAAAAAKKKTTTEEEDEMAAAPADLFGGGDDY